MRRGSARSTRRDLIGGPIFWGAAMVTLVALIACFFLRSGRAWLGLGVLLTWTAFSLVNAVRSRRLHSIVSTPVYLAAAAALAGSATGRIDVQIWMIWLLGAGIIAANLSERFFGRYLR
jgi:phosphatidylserine synthase